MTSEVLGFLDQGEEWILFYLQWEVIVEFEVVSPPSRRLTMKEKKGGAVAQGRDMYAQPRRRQ